MRYTHSWQQHVLFLWIYLFSFLQYHSQSLTELSLLIFHKNVKLWTIKIRFNPTLILGNNFLPSQTQTGGLEKIIVFYCTIVIVIANCLLYWALCCNRYVVYEVLCIVCIICVHCNVYYSSVFWMYRTNTCVPRIFLWSGIDIFYYMCHGLFIVILCSV